MVHPDVALDAVVGLALGGETGCGVEIDLVSGRDLGGIFAFDLVDSVLISNDQGDFNETVVVRTWLPE